MTAYHKKFPAFFALVASCLAIIALSGCGPKTLSPKQPVPSPLEQQTNTPPATIDNDPLRIGDKVHIDFSGIPTKIDPIETEIKGDGTITFEYLGPLKAAGLTPGEFENEIKTNYVPNYYTHLNVNVTPVARFFYVGGMINQTGTGGRQPYVGPITVTRAIQSAGDFNDFADRKHVKLTRYNGKQIIVNCAKAIEHPEHPEWDPPVFPGDSIYVPRRLF